MVRFATKQFLGIDVVDTDYDNFVSTIMESSSISNPINIMSLNLTSLKRFDKEFKFFVDTFDYTTADGKGLVIFSGLLGDKIQHHLSIPRICDRLIEKCHQGNKKLFLLGARTEVNKKAILNIRKKYPGIIVKGHHGYFNLDNMSHIEDELIMFQPDVVLVGISSPMKERVILKFSPKYYRSINVACGGYIDILSGEIGKAPKILHHSGLEWLYRFYQEPKRMLRRDFFNGLFFLFYIFPIAFISKYIFSNQPAISTIMKNNNNIKRT